MTSTFFTLYPPSPDRTVVASYQSKPNAEVAIRRLSSDVLPITQLSIIQCNFEMGEDCQPFYQPADETMDEATPGDGYGCGIFDLMFVAMGVFILPIVGSLTVIGPLAGLLATTIGGTGAGALVHGFVQMGLPHDEALAYQERLKNGEFLVLLQGSKDEAARARYLLRRTAHTLIRTHTSIIGKSNVVVGAES
jgi:hypothetical protein